MTILIIVAVVLLVLFVGGLFAWLFTRVDTVVTDTKEEIVQEQKAYNPAVTMGHEIKVDADYATQLKEARREAARAAAALPRGGNFGIGSLGNPLVSTASKGLAEDPMTAVRIAHFHGWDGARSGVPAGGVPVAAAAPAAVAAATATAAEVELLPGRDYEVIEITDAMSPEEVRKARVANAKAKSAATKAAKAAQTGAAPAVAAAGAAVAAAPAAAAAVPVGIDPPKLIEITDDMPPEEVRKARVANAKAQSAYNKALKAAGGTPGMATAAVAETAAPVAAAAPAPVAPVGIEPPQLIVITDDMAPEDVRKARVANAKAQSAYNKALKAAGIDPSAVSADAGAGGVPVAAAPQATPEPAPATVAADTAAPAAPAGGPTPESLGIARPDLIEITDGMSPDEIRQARIANAKAQSAFNKALKAAGIDPATVQ